jgi:peroxiredoxin (alkyl hydroperoxide reductase subunit C)
MGAELITVSTDTEFVHLAWKRDEKELADVKYLMGSDPTGRLSRLFGVYDSESGLALRGSFIIAPDGTLFNSEVNFYNMGRNIDELMRKFKANLYLSRKADEGCPSKWKRHPPNSKSPSTRESRRCDGNAGDRLDDRNQRASPRRWWGPA